MRYYGWLLALSFQAQAASVPLVTEIFPPYQQLNAAGQAVFENYVLLPGEVDRHFPRGTRPESLSDWQREQQQQQQQ